LSATISSSVIASRPSLRTSRLKTHFGAIGFIQTNRLRVSPRTSMKYFSGRDAKAAAQWCS
jgi:hypothetical protein